MNIRENINRIASNYSANYCRMTPSKLLISVYRKRAFQQFGMPFFYENTDEGVVCLE